MRPNAPSEEVAKAVDTGRQTKADANAGGLGSAPCKIVCDEDGEEAETLRRPASDAKENSPEASLASQSTATEPKDRQRTADRPGGRSPVAVSRSTRQQRDQRLAELARPKQVPGEEDRVPRARDRRQKPVSAVTRRNEAQALRKRPQRDFKLGSPTPTVLKGGNGGRGEEPSPETMWRRALQRGETAEGEPCGDEPSGETPRETPCDTPHDTPCDTPRETPQGSPHETPRETPRATPRETPRDPPKETPRDGSASTQSQKLGPDAVLERVEAKPVRRDAPRVPAVRLTPGRGLQRFPPASIEVEADRLGAASPLRRAPQTASSPNLHRPPLPKKKPGPMSPVSATRDVRQKPAAGDFWRRNLPEHEKRNGAFCRTPESSAPNSARDGAGSDAGLGPKPARAPIWATSAELGLSRASRARWNHQARVETIYKPSAEADSIDRRPQDTSEDVLKSQQRRPGTPGVRDTPGYRRVNLDPSPRRLAQLSSAGGVLSRTSSQPALGLRSP